MLDGAHAPGRNTYLVREGLGDGRARRRRSDVEPGKAAATALAKLAS